MVYQSHTQLSVLIADNPTVLPLLNRFGIRLGVGHSSVRQAAGAHGMDERFLLEIINTYLNSDYFPENELKGFPLQGISDYLLRTNISYRDVQLPNVDRHFRHFVDRSYSPDTNLNRLYEYFQQLQHRFLDEIDSADRLLEKVIILGKDGRSALNSSDEQQLIEFASAHNHSAFDSLTDLINLFIIHLRGTYDTNLCHAVINALVSLSNDMRQNNRICDRILSPMLLNRLCASR